MSELINNREYRRKLLKEVIKELHRGKSVAEELCVYSLTTKTLSYILLKKLWGYALSKKHTPIPYFCDFVKFT